MHNSLKIKAIAEKYASALYEMAAAEKKLETVSLAVDTLRAALEASSEFQRFIANKSLSNLLKQQGIIAVVEAALPKKKPDALFLHFLGVLGDNNRLDVLLPITHVFADLQLAADGVIKADVTSAAPLSDEQQTTLSDALANTLKTKILLKLHTNTDLLGGLKVRVGSRLYDSSLSTQLQRLRTHLLTQ